MSLHNKGNLLKYIGFATGLVGVFVGAFFITEAFLRLPETGQGGFDSPIRPVNMGLGEGENKTEGEISSGDLALEAKDPESASIKAELEKYFYIKECKLGSDPVLAINSAKAEGYALVPAEPSKDGVLMVMMEDYDAKFAKFEDGRIAIGIKMTDESMKILENIQSIGFILFHTRKDEGQHLFALKSSCEVRPQASLDDSVYMNINTTNLYLLVSFDSSAELDSSSIHSSKAPWTKQSRYDAQYVSLETIHSN